MTKIKFTLSILLICFFTIAINAKEVNTETAMKVASNYLVGNQKRAKARFASPSLSLTHTERYTTKKRAPGAAANSEQAPTYYVFSKGSNQGFIIVAADDVAVPILGNVDTGDYDDNNLPANFAYWMGFLSEEIAYAQENNSTQANETKKLWEAYTSGVEIATQTTTFMPMPVEPLLKTKWAQAAPYNSVGGQAFTGSVATAMAQIMKYHGHPKQARTVEIPGYTTATSMILIPAIEGSTIYDWDMMKDIYSGSEGADADTVNAVATLMYHCGVSVETDYKPKESVANSENVGAALTTYFDYDKTAIKRSRVDYRHSEWEWILKTELAAGRPVYYEGVDKNNNQHAFVCDGFNIAGEFHFNWGQGGTNDGFFALSAIDNDDLKPYPADQIFWESIKPNTTEDGLYKPVGRLINFKLGELDNGNNWTELDKPTFVAGDEDDDFYFKLDLDYNFSDLENSAIVIAVVDKDGNPDPSYFFIDAAYSLTQENGPTQEYTSKLPPGKHTLGVAVTLDCVDWDTGEGSEWYWLDECFPAATNRIEIEVLESGDVVVDKEFSLCLSGVNGLANSNPLNINGEVSFKAGYQNTSEVDSFTGSIGLASVNDKNEIEKVIASEYIVNLGAGSTASFTFTCSGSALGLGNHKLQVVARSTDGENWVALDAAENGSPNVFHLSVVRISDIALNNQEISLSESAIAPGSTVTTNSLTIINAAAAAFTGELYWALFNCNDEIIGDPTIVMPIEGLLQNTTTNVNAVNITIPESTPVGYYKIRFVTKRDGDENWAFVNNNPSSSDAYAEIIVKQEGDNITHNLKVRNIFSSANICKGAKFNVYASASNKSTEAFTGWIGVALVNNSGDIVAVGSVSDNTLSAGTGWSSREISCTMPSDIAAGTYKMYLVAKTNESDAWAIVGKENENAVDFISVRATANSVDTNLRLISDMVVLPEVSQIKQGENLLVRGYIANKGTKAFSGDIAVVLVNGEIEKEIGWFEDCQLDVEGKDFFDIPCIVPRKMGLGNYDVKFLAKVEDPQSTQIVTKADGASGLTDARSLEIITRAVLHKLETQTILDVPTVISRNTHFTPVVRCVNRDAEEFVGDLAVALINANGQIVKVIEHAADGMSGKKMATGKTYDLSFTNCVISDTVSIDNGSYKFCLLARLNDQDWSIANGADGVAYTVDIQLVSTTSNVWISKSSTAWGEATNWSMNLVPTSEHDVVIPAGAAYPVAIEGAVAKTIYLQPNAELGNQHLLRYEKAFVAYDFGIGDRSKDFRMLSLPLKEGYPGDFTFGACPKVYLQTLELGLDGKGKWTTALRNDNSLTLGTGFVLSVEADNASITDKGLALSNGILKIPFFDEEASGVSAAVHPNHSYANGESTFANPGKASETYNVARSANAYKLADESFSLDLANSPVFALVGNPFVSTIDFDKLYSTNEGLIKNSYQVWTGQGYVAYNRLDGNYGESADNVTKLIAPLQGFVVEKVEDASNTSLSFKLTDLAPDANGAPQRANLATSATKANKLNITASNPVASVLTYIAKREGGSATFTRRDGRKLMNQPTDIPDVFTIKPTADQYPMLVGGNIVDCNDVEYPLALATTYSGEITFNFSGMDSYEADIYFVDKAANVTLDLTDKASFDYTFDHNADLSETADEYRFYIRIQTHATGIGEVRQSLNVYTTQNNICVDSHATNPITSIRVYKPQGEMVYTVAFANAETTQHIVEAGLETGVYIVQVNTENGVETRKISIVNN